jgi:hypothetical protein
MSGVPIIFMTGLSETDDIVRAFDAGGVDYLTKPIIVEEMLARIHAHIANARLTRSARAALDVSGRFLFAVSRAGAVVWATPRAQELLAEFQAGVTPGQRAPWASWFGDEALRGAPNVPPPETRIGDMRVVTGSGRRSFCSSSFPAIRPRPRRISAAGSASPSARARSCTGSPKERPIATSRRF